MKNTVATASFRYMEDGAVKIFRPGNVVNNPETAKWAISQKYAEVKEDGPPRKQTNSKIPPGQKVLNASKGQKGAPENKDAAQTPNNPKLQDGGKK